MMLHVTVYKVNRRAQLATWNIFEYMNNKDVWCQCLGALHDCASDTGDTGDTPTLEHVNTVNTNNFLFQQLDKRTC